MGGNFSVVFIFFHNNHRAGPPRPRLQLRESHGNRTASAWQAHGKRMAIQFNSTDSLVAAPALLPEN
jgi:hypothetical protein